MKTKNIQAIHATAIVALLLAGRAAAQYGNLCGPSTGSQFGCSIGNAGDVNGDGLNDIIVGAKSATNPSTGAVTGAAYVYTASGTLLWAWYGSGDLFGFSVAGAGDVDNDGRADLIVGAPDASPGGFLRAGRAIVYSGRTGAQLFEVDGSVTELHLGYSVAGAGNVNGDAYADVIVGSNWLGSGGPGFPGLAEVFVGPTGTFRYAWTGDADNSVFGNAVASAGDVNGDGLSDLIVGAPGANFSAGMARVFSGANGQTLCTLYSAFPGLDFGWSVASAGDVNGDGRSDVIVGQPRGQISTTIRGTAQVFNAVTGVLLQGWEGDATGEKFGFAVASAGDVDRDGRADLLIGVPEDGSITPGGGGVRVFSGRTGLRLFAIAQGSNQVLEAGSAVAGLGNAFSNNAPEFAYAAALGDCNGIDTGMVWIYSMPEIFRFALGDGSGTQCPCNQYGGPGSGCANPSAPTGGRLDACGSASVSADTVRLGANNLTPSTLLFVQGTTQSNNGRGTPYGNGILGIGGSIIRLGVKTATPMGGDTGCLFGGFGNGAIYPGPGDPTLSVRGMVPPVGGSRDYQVWYRTPPGCGGANTNWTNGISVAWGP